MTLPDEVVKGISQVIYEYADFNPQLLRMALERIALLTRRLTIEECAKVCDARAIVNKSRLDMTGNNAGRWMSSGQEEDAAAIRQLEGK